MNILTEQEIRVFILAASEVLAKKAKRLEAMQQRRNDEVIRRGKQAAASFVGSFAVSVFTAIRSGASHEVNLDIKKTSVACLSVGAFSALVWFFMPRANEEISDAMDDLKEQLEPAVKLAATAVLNTEVGGIPEEFKGGIPNYTTTTIRNDGRVESVRAYKVDPTYKTPRSAAAGSIFDEEDDRQINEAMSEWTKFHDPWDIPGLDDEDLTP